ncbi:PREDICTED: S- [Prunus dulcis]|uniref:S-protein homolog n=2 Tax=Prunus dulcis TaxID=3755 RepID=A0A5E4G658_PRUDU|nr:PREDICTED: S- [Prunus dulcis]
MMGSTPRWQLHFFLVLLALAFVGQISCFNPDPIPGRKHFVRLVNNLRNGQLLVKCGSETPDDLLGEHLLGTNEEYEFGFRMNLYRTKFYRCDMSYSNYHNRFEAFTATKHFLEKCGGVHCIWRAQEDGISLYNIKHDQWSLIYGWEIQRI